MCFVFIFHAAKIVNDFVNLSVPKKNCTYFLFLRNIIMLITIPKHRNLDIASFKYAEA